VKITCYQLNSSTDVEK